MTNKERKKLRREWGQWKRNWLSEKEKKNLEYAMFVEFLLCKGYEYLFTYTEA